MTHLKGSQDADLHHEDGSHRTTPASTSGTVLANHERRLRAHLAAHGITTGWTPAIEAEVEARYGQTMDELVAEAEAGYDPAKMRPTQRQREAKP